MFLFGYIWYTLSGLGYFFAVHDGELWEGTRSEIFWLLLQVAFWPISLVLSGILFILECLTGD